jgi:biotin carboxyl carrier protein
VAAGLLLCIVGVLGWIPSPWARRVPVVIQYQDEQIARASTDGFITAVHVRSGQPVAPGDLLVEIEAPELTLQRDALLVDEKASRLRARQLSRQNKLAMAAAELERHASLRRQKSELDRQVNALQLRAERAGIVSSYAVERWTGKYVRQGEVLLRIGDEANKEILASIGGGDLDAYLLAAREGAVRPVRLRGGFDLSVPLHLPRPRVSVNIPHPALSSRAGGPLAVQTSDEAEEDEHDTTQLVAPRSHSICRLDPETSRRVRVGQQGMMMIGDTRSVWNRLGDFFRTMLDAER